MARKQKMLQKSSSSLSVRSIGVGEMERIPSPSASSGPAFENKNAHTTEDDEKEFVVVRSFRAFTSKWLHFRAPDSSTTATKASSTDSNSTSEEEMEYDTSTDLAYHNAKEREGSDRIRHALTQEEVEAMPDDFMPLRHYRAEKGDVGKAIDAIKHTLQWRKEFEVDKIVRALEDDVKAKDSDKFGGYEEEDFAAILRKENETGKIYVRGYDKDGRAMMYMRPGRENTMNEDNNMRHLVFQIEKAVRCSQKNGYGKICLVIDYEGFHISKTPPMSTTKRTLDILQRHFCERMHRAYICNPPFVFRSFYAVIKPFVDPVTKQKVCWCVGKKGMEEVVADVGGPEKAEGQLEACCGGNGDKVRDFNSGEYMRLRLDIAFDE